jgi:biotin carboxyl carrier protein
MRYQVTVGGETFQVEVDGEVVTVDGTSHAAELLAVPGTPLRLLLLDHASWVLPMSPGSESTWEVSEGGEQFEAEVLDERTAHIRSLAGAGAAPAGPTLLKAPMPGMVTKVHVRPGQEVAIGASLVTLEAMKMENDLRAAGPGIVELVSATPGETVEKGAILVTFRSS